MKRKETIQDYKRQTKKELAITMQEKQTALANLRFDLPVGKVKNIREIRHIRRDIARAKTLLKQKEN